MANTLCDRNVDLSNIVESIQALIQAGWPAGMIKIHLDSAMLMAAIRNKNDGREF